MSVDATKLIIPGHGTVFQSAPNLPCPSDPLSAFTLTGDGPQGWSNLGHTSKQNTIAFSKEGGEATTLDTFLADAVRVINSSNQWSLAIPALQFDQDTLDLAFNGDWDRETNGYIIPGSPASTEAGLFLLLQDNTGKLGFWIPNTSVTLGEAPSVDTANFLELPLTSSILAAPESVMPAVDGKPGIMQLFKTGLTPPTGP